MNCWILLLLLIGCGGNCSGNCNGNSSGSCSGSHGSPGAGGNARELRCDDSQMWTPYMGGRERDGRDGRERGRERDNDCGCNNERV